MVIAFATQDLLGQIMRPPSQPFNLFRDQMRFYITRYDSLKTYQSSKSEVQRRPPDSYGSSGQGETLQAYQSGSPHAPWKAGGRSGTKRTDPLPISQLE